MRVIILNDHGYVSGGAAQVAIAGLNRLAIAGIDVTFVAAVGPICSEIDQGLVRVICLNQCDLIGNPSRLDAAIKGLWNIESAKSVSHLLSEYNPSDTIVHIHTWVKSFSPSVVHEILYRGFKVVCTLHDYFTVCPNGGLFNYPHIKHCNISPMSLMCLASNCDSRSYGQKVWRYCRHLIQEKLAGIPSKIDSYISVSDYSESILRPFLPARAKIFRVRNPIYIERSLPADPSENQAFSFVGRLSQEKGAILFATAAQRLGIEANYVGDGVDAPAVRRIHPQANFLGWLDRQGVINTLKTSRALVFPSLWHETQGLVVLEAAALGIPAIVSDGCAAKEAIVDGETGLLFRSGDINDLCQKLRILRDDPQLAYRLGRKAYERYWSNPSTLDKHVDELISCYKKILFRER
ncbi:MAG: glycosyltransferase [Candidatus Methanomethylicaceae archaeon]